jgi:hypothetical protein
MYFGVPRSVRVAPLVMGETLTTLGKQRGLSEREWDVGWHSIPTFMETM